MNVIAFSGGYDSTALALRWSEVGEPAVLLNTPTGNEPRDVRPHILRIAEVTGWEIVLPPTYSLMTLIEKFTALPNPRMRWCTRMIKIEPCIAWLKEHPGSKLLVGLRADEPEREGGLYGDYTEYGYPLREWGWSRRDVVDYCRAKGMAPPARTDCALCPYQRLSEWYGLWKSHPDEYELGVRLEAQISEARQAAITFRSPSRDTWPAGLAELRAEFEKGRVPRGADFGQLTIFDTDDPAESACRVCRM